MDSANDDSGSHKMGAACVEQIFFTKACIQEFSAALVGKDLSNFVPLVDGEAKQSAVSVAHQAAISRLCPIQDAHEFWSLLEEKGRSSPDIGSGGSAPI
jgi:hypothetical protein